MSSSSWDSAFSGRSEEAHRLGRLPRKRHSYFSFCSPHFFLLGWCSDETAYGRKGPKIPILICRHWDRKWAILGVIWYCIPKHPWFYSRYLCRIHLLGLEYFFFQMDTEFTLGNLVWKTAKMFLFFSETVCFKNHLASDYLLAWPSENGKAWVEQLSVFDVKQLSL